MWYWCERELSVRRSGGGGGPRRGGGLLSGGSRGSGGTSPTASTTESAGDSVESDGSPGASDVVHMPVTVTSLGAGSVQATKSEEQGDSARGGAASGDSGEPWRVMGGCGWW